MEDLQTQMKQLYAKMGGKDNQDGQDKKDPFSESLRTILMAMQKKFENGGTNPSIQDMLNEG